MAQLTTAYSSDGPGNLNDLVKKHNIDKLVAEPDFGTKNGYIFTAMKGSKAVSIRLADVTAASVDAAIRKAAERLEESL
jgi:hypothetical protein